MKTKRDKMIAQLLINAKALKPGITPEQLENHRQYLVRYSDDMLKHLLSNGGVK